MIFRTDLALEAREAVADKVPKGVAFDEQKQGDVTITKIEVQTEEGAKAIGKPVGKYITVEVPPFSESTDDVDSRLTILADQISAMLPEKGLVLVAGLGNSNITPDALGPKTASKVLATRHIAGEFARSAGLDHLRPVAVIAPGVLGQTGVETSELITSIANKIEPAAIIVVDALASRSTDRLGCTIQICDSGISPGSGVGNRRAEISLHSIGVPVIAVGVPTVVDAITLASDLMESSDQGISAAAREKMLKEKAEPRGSVMMVTPREIDLLIDHAAFLVALAINKALQPGIAVEDMLSLVNN